MDCVEFKPLFCNLPVEMKLEIFRRLSLASKKSSRQVSTFWKMLIDEKLVLRPELNDSNLSTVVNSSLPVVSLIISKLQSKISISTSRNNWLEDVRKIILEEDSGGISEENFKKILSHCCRQLILLHFESLALKNVTRVSTLWKCMDFNNVSHLRILLHTYEYNNSRAFENLLTTAKFPALYEFKISFADISVEVYHYPVKPYTRILTCVYNFIAKHSSTLKNLWLYEAEELTKVEAPIQIVLDDETISALSKLNLQRFRLFLGNFDINHPTWPAICLAENHTNLMTLDIWGAPVPSNFIKTVQNNIPSLKQLYWTSDHVEPDGDNSFDCSLIANAVNLTHFDISANEIFNVTSLPKTIQRLVWSSDLTADQLLWITENMKMVKVLILEENLDNETDIPYINVLTLKQVLRMENLGLFKVYGLHDGKGIAEFCSNTPGISFEPKPDTDVEDEYSRVKGRVGFKILIDRVLLHPIYLL